jgi:hypothetical protein
MGNNANIPNFANVSQFKVLRNESLTIPDSVDEVSPSSLSSGLSPSNIFNSKRQGVGGYIYAAFSDAAGPASLDFQYKVKPGDIVAVSNAAAPAVVTVNGTTVFTITNTAVAGVLGYYS